MEEEKPSLRDEDFEDRLAELGIESFGRDVKLRVDFDKLERVGSCNLMKYKVVSEDELQKVVSCKSFAKCYCDCCFFKI